MKDIYDKSVEAGVKETIKKIEKEWVNPYFHKDNDKKVFYHWYEWTGWRFYLKAFRHKDWKSIKRKLLSTSPTSKNRGSY